MAEHWKTRQKRLKDEANARGEDYEEQEEVVEEVEEIKPSEKIYRVLNNKSSFVGQWTKEQAELLLVDFPGWFITPL